MSLKNWLCSAELKDSFWDTKQHKKGVCVWECVRMGGVWGWRYYTKQQ